MLLIVAAVSAYLTNPTEVEMREALGSRLKTVFNESMEERKSNVIAYTAWKAGGDKMVDFFMQKYATVDNNYLFSLVKIHWENKTYSIGIGAFNKVYINDRLNKELADNIIDNAQKMLMDDVNDILKGFLKKTNFIYK